MLRDLTPEEAARRASIGEQLRAASEALAVERRVGWLIKTGLTEDDARAAAATTGDGGATTQGGYPVQVIDDPSLQVQLAEGGAITMAEFVRDARRYARQQCADLVDPEYRDDPRIAVLHEDGTVFSHAHGGVVYKPSSRVRVEAAFGHLDDDEQPSAVEAGATRSADAAEPSGTPGPASSSQAAGPAGATPAPQAAEPMQPASSESPKPRKLPVRSLAELMAQPRPEYLVKGLLPLGSLCMMFGASGAGKTFCALDVAMAIARGVEWMGLRVKQGAVLYVAAEGQYGVGQRARAYMKHHGVDDALPFYVVPRPIDLNSKDGEAGATAVVEACDSISAHGGQVRLVVLDTLNRVMGGADENSAEDMALAISGADYIKRKTGATVLLVHHSGKDAAKGARGHSSLRAAVDAEIEVSRAASGSRTAKVTKSRDGEDGTTFGFDLRRVVLGVDEDLDEITSCVVVPCAVPQSTTPAAGSAVAAPGGKWQRALISELANATDGLSRSAVVERAMATAGASGSKCRSNADRALGGLLEKGLVTEVHGLFFQADPFGTRLH